MKYFAESKLEIGRIYDTARNSEGFVEKVENLNGSRKGGYRLWNSEGMGITHFGISEVKRGLK